MVVAVVILTVSKLRRLIINNIKVYRINSCLAGLREMEADGEARVVLKIGRQLKKQNQN